MTQRSAQGRPSRGNAELLDSWRAGDAAAGDELFTRHFRPVSRFFVNKVSSDRVADLVQETFVVCVEGRDRIADGDRFRAYLLTIAYRVLCRHFQARYRGDAPLNLDVLATDTIESNPTSVLVRTQEERLLLEGLRSIPTNYQLVLELFYWENLKTPEIAMVLGIPSGTVRSRLTRARSALEAELTRLAKSREALESTLTHLEDWAERCRDALGDAAQDGQSRRGLNTTGTVGSAAGGSGSSTSQ